MERPLTERQSLKVAKRILQAFDANRPGAILPTQESIDEAFRAALKAIRGQQ
jgi:hypothetical protein